MRYLVFAYEEIYPVGGWGDFESAHATIEEAKLAGKELLKRYGFCDIVDMEKLERVELMVARPRPPFPAT